MTTETTIKPFDAPSAADERAVREVVADYYGSWFEVQPDRMARTLHPDLAKRGWIPDEHGAHVLDADTSVTMVEWTGRGVGRRDEPDERALEIRVAEVYGDIATVLVHAARYIETLQLIRTADGWRILNALWCTP